MSKTDCIRTVVLLFDEHVYICIGEYVVVLYNFKRHYMLTQSRDIGTQGRVL